MTGSRRRWVYALVIGWAVLLAGIAFLPVVGGDATVAEHRSATQARPIVDRAVADAVSAGGPDVAVTVTGYLVRKRCQVAQVRDGGDFARVADLYTAPGGEKALLQRLAGKFRQYEVLGPSRNGAFRVRLPEFVSLQAIPAGSERTGATDKGSPNQPDPKGTGIVRVTVSTGCRPIDEPVTTFHAPPTGSERQRLAPTLEALGVADGTWTTQRLGCHGGEVRTVEVTAPATADTSQRLGQLRPPLPAKVLVHQPDLLAYRDGPTSVVARLSGEDLTVVSTVDCAAR